jgi:hypothetical protein
LDNAIPPSLPAFIKALPDTLDPTDLQYLQAKNAFSLPSREFHDVCVARYLEFAHPLLPLLDQRQLLSTLRNEDGNGEQISLLLFHAVMLSGVTFVEDEWILGEGFSSRQAARRAFFDRAKVGRRLSDAFLFATQTKSVHLGPFQLQLGPGQARRLPGRRPHGHLAPREE